MSYILLVFLLIGCTLLYLLFEEIKKQQSERHPSGKTLRRRLAKSRKEFIGKSEQWHQANVKQTLKPSTGRGIIPSTTAPGAKTPKPTTKPNTQKPAVILPPPPPPNGKLSTPSVETVPSVLPDLAALVRAKRKQSVLQPASATSKNRLDSLTKDRRVSDRLVKTLMFANPDRSEQWAVDKAIYDLERDRI